ncbi:MAG: hypothetical protein AB4040_18700 [Synechococcus sp.]
MQDIAGKRTEDEIALLLGDGGPESKLKAKALVFSIERAIAPLAERIDKLEARSATVSKVVGSVGLALGTVAGGATFADVQAISSRETLDVVDKMRSIWRGGLPASNCWWNEKFNIAMRESQHYSA